MPEKFISIEGIAKRFPAPGGGTATVFENLWFAMQRGEFACIIGHSGCGKTTVLNILAGLDVPSTGAVIVDARRSGPSLDRAVIFQSHALLPWRTVMGNVAYAVASKWRRWTAAQIRRARAEIHRPRGADRLRAQAPGGAFRRHEAARRHRPRALDRAEDHADGRAVLARSTRSPAARCRTRCGASASTTGQTVFMITHDVDEAIYLADRIVLMTNGPGAVLAEIVENPLPKNARTRNDIHRHPLYYPVRNHIIDFLVTRSRTFTDETTQLRQPPCAGGADRPCPSPRWSRPPPSRRRYASPAAAPLTHRTRSDQTVRKERAMKRAELTEKILDIKREKGWTLEIHLRADRRHVADADHGSAARADEADQAAGRQGRRTVRPLDKPKQAMLNEVPDARHRVRCRRPIR